MIIKRIVGNVGRSSGLESAIFTGTFLTKSRPLSRSMINVLLLYLVNLHPYPKDLSYLSPNFLRQGANNGCVPNMTLVNKDLDEAWGDGVRK